MRNQKTGFTLIELLVVIGIILILGGLMFPAFSAAREFARKAKAKTDVKQTEIAFKAILSDYRSWQGAKNATPALPTVTPGGAKQIIGSELVRYLSGANKKRVPYMEFDGSATNKSGEFSDPWKNGYCVIIGEREVDTPQSGKLYRDVAVWSIGADHAENTKDDVKSWE